MADANKDKNWFVVACKFLGVYWKSTFVVIWPIISLIVFLLGFETKFRCMYVVILMAGYWLTECIPLFVTGLMPLALMPLLNIVSSKDIAVQYMNSTTALFAAGILIAISIEHCGLHLRIALLVMLGLGCSPRRLHFGLTCVTTFLSMWLVNAAATAMMCPIIMAVLEQLEQEGILKVYEPASEDSDEPPRPTKITLAYFLTVAYSSTIGGIGTLVGTGTNLTYKGLFEEKFIKGDKIDFLNWLLFNIPGMLIMMFGNWFFLQISLMGLFRKNTPEHAIVEKGNTNKDLIRNLIKERLKGLGPMSWQEIAVLTLFIAAVAMWLFRSPQIIPGWADFDVYPKGFIKDSSFPYIVIVLFLAVPATCSFIQFCTLDGSKRPKKPSQALVTWEVFQKKFPWGLMFLLGGGFALSYSGNASGMSKYLGEKMVGLKTLPSFIILAICSFLASVLTELTSNVAICNLFIPILMDMSIAMRIHPALYTYPAAICCSFAFCMPVGTPANAIIVGVANVRVIDFLMYGWPIKIWTWLIIISMFPTYGLLFFDLQGTPSWLDG